MPDFVSRQEWGARYAPGPIVASSKRREFIVHHTVTPAESHDRCPARLRAIEQGHHDKWGKSVGYNEVVCSHGTVYEGCGANRIGQHSPNHNTVGIGVALLGDGRLHVPSQVVASFASRLQVHETHVGRRLLLLGHRDVRDTVCPGDRLYDALPDIRWAADHFPIPSKVAPMFNPAIAVPSPFVAEAWPKLDGQVIGHYQLTEDGRIYAWGYARLSSQHGGMPYAQPYWGERKAARIEITPTGYRVLATTGEPYEYAL